MLYRVHLTIRPPQKKTHRNCTSWFLFFDTRTGRVRNYIENSTGKKPSLSGTHSRADAPLAIALLILIRSRQGADGVNHTVIVGAGHHDRRHSGRGMVQAQHHSRHNRWPHLILVELHIRNVLERRRFMRLEIDRRLAVFLGGIARGCSRHRDRLVRGFQMDHVKDCNERAKSNSGKSVKMVCTGLILLDFGNWIEKKTFFTQIIKKVKKNNGT